MCHTLHIFRIIFLIVWSPSATEMAVPVETDGLMSSGNIVEYRVQKIIPLMNKCFIQVQRSRSVIECVMVARGQGSIHFKFHSTERNCYMCLPVNSVTDENISDLPEAGESWGTGTNKTNSRFCMMKILMD